MWFQHVSTYPKFKRLVGLNMFERRIARRDDHEPRTPWIWCWDRDQGHRQIRWITWRYLQIHTFWLVVLTILKNMKVNGKYYPICYGNKKHVSNHHQPNILCPPYCGFNYIIKFGGYQLTSSYHALSHPNSTPPQNPWLSRGITHIWDHAMGV